jgi:hypothetical protein
MRNSPIFFISVTSIFMLSAIIATNFMESIVNPMELAGLNISTLLPNPEFEILLCLSLVGIVCVNRNKGNK